MDFTTDMDQGLKSDFLFLLFSMGVSIALFLCLASHCRLEVWGADHLNPLFTGLQIKENCMRGLQSRDHNWRASCTWAWLDYKILDRDPEPNALMGWDVRSPVGLTLQCERGINWVEREQPLFFFTCPHQYSQSRTLSFHQQEVEYISPPL